MLEGVHVVHGGGAVSAAHDERLIDRTVAACAEAAALIRKAAG